MFTFQFSTAYEHFKGRGTKEYYGYKPDEYDMLSPGQKFALVNKLENVKIIRSNSSETFEFKLDDYKHINIEPTEEKQEIEEFDEDNVA